MKRASRLVLVFLLLAALPLRGYAGELTALCEVHHGGAAAAQEHVHEYGDSLHVDSGLGGDPAHAPSVCSICASCCAGASVAPDANALVAIPTSGIDRISFFDHCATGVVLEHFDRPPLAS